MVSYFPMRMEAILRSQVEISCLGPNASEGGFQDQQAQSWWLTSSEGLVAPCVVTALVPTTGFPSAPNATKSPKLGIRCHWEARLAPGKAPGWGPWEGACGATGLWLYQQGGNRTLERALNLESGNRTQSWLCPLNAS